MRRCLAVKQLFTTGRRPSIYEIVFSILGVIFLGYTLGQERR